MKMLFTILVIISLSFLSSCDLFDNDPKLPPITTEGKGTFGCLVNGELFLPEAPLGYGTGVRAELYKNDTLTSLNIYASNSNTKQTLIIAILDKPELQLGIEYRLGDTTCCGIDYVSYKISPSCRYSEVISGNLKILKFDITNPQHMIIAGTFEITASSVECGEISITSGRFDISDVFK